MSITAKEAREITNKSIQKNLNICRPALLIAILDRIETAANNGDYKIMLNSISDVGHGIRGPGMYLTPGVTEALCDLLKEKGFVITYVEESANKNRTVEVSW
jgi:hypothetical protein